MATRAGVSENDFTEIFPTIEECHRAAFEQGLKRLSLAVDKATGRESSWLDRLRAGLVAFLGFLDDEPAWARLLILEPSATDGVVGLCTQLRVVGVLTSLLDDGAPQAVGEHMLEPSLTAEFVVGGAVSVIRAQMLKGDPTVLVGLAPSLMSFIVRPYLGQVAANTELEGRPSANHHVSSTTSGPPRKDKLARLASLPIRVTHRTTMVLRAIAQAPYSNNREIAEAAGLADEGQTSKLLARLERQGVIENVGIGAARGEPNAWLLTLAGQRALAAIGDAATPRARGTRVRGEA
ncbi:MAG TPA: winged helix-turn-helix domain-containing protein [Solirubrobacteraceae bacterium]|nr:winged helix-turn-helix domain-containing protein [Solirubrobacteraceae bacterium]